MTIDIADLSFETMPTGASDSGVGQACGVIILLTWIFS